MSEPSPAPGTGTLLSRYRLGEKLGQGGMGVVYEAFDTRLERKVAVKLLPPEAVGDPERRERFVREAKSASALNHPHIVTVYDIDRVATAEGEHDLIAMELIEGETLGRRLERGRLSIEETITFALQLSDALAVAHRAGIVHRDVKPGNLMIGSDGRLKLLDFGLSRYAPTGEVDPAAPTVAHGLTTTGALVGTPAYMSPEQAEGKSVDARADVFAAGAVIYEMATRRRPFAAETQVGQLMAVLRDTPPSLRTIAPEVPAELERIVARCLAKDRDARYASAGELHAELERLRSSRAGKPPSLLAAFRRPVVAVPLALVLLAGLAAIAIGVQRARERSRARQRLAEVERLVGGHRFVQAFVLARELEPLLPGDRELERQFFSTTIPVTVRTNPPGATVEFRGYLEDPNVWYPVGTSPIERVRLPATALLFRARLPGFVEAIGAPSVDLGEAADTFVFELTPEGDDVPGMIRVPAGRGGYDRADLELDSFWIGRHEVTNLEFGRFVEAGGYRDRALWREPFVENGRALTFEEASARFVDATGRPGPASWKFGAIPEGFEQHPVTGVSWYEADAYARWAGGELPTLHHWFLAAQQENFSEILQRGNFSGTSTIAAGTSHAFGPYGTVDMAGNAFEWTSTDDGDGRRYIAGGAYDEPSYTYAEPGAISPFDRSADRGLRLARYPSEPIAESKRPVVARPFDPSEWRPVDDSTFEVYRSLFTRPTGDLHAEVESVDDVSPHYRWERVRYDAGFGGERMQAHLLLPKNARPPYQVVVYFPPSPAERLPSSQALDSLPWFEFLVRGGRALLFPVYSNTYERRIPGWKRSPETRRDLVLRWSSEIARSIDYLESRSDIDRGKIAFYGFSLGAVWGTVLTAVEPRIKVNVFLGGGVTVTQYRPEVNPVNFAPRLTIPTLMLTGKDDFVRPIETRQEPLFRLYGTPEGEKKLVAFAGGHVPSDMTSVAREALAWLDRWLGTIEVGPVEPAPR